MTYVNCGFYDGEWKNGDRNGRGKFTWSDGDVYDGEWKDGEAAQQDPAPAVNKQPPDHFCDMSFSMELMVDPVMAADGFTYERASIEKWLVNHNT